MRKNAFLLCITIALLCFGVYFMVTTNDSNAAKLESGTTVTLDVYSGKPNPSWKLSREESEELLKRLGVLASTEEQVAEFDGLGYREVQVVVIESGKEVAISASQGFVKVQRGGVQKRFVDSGRTVELWLVQSGERQLPPELFKTVVARITATAR